MNQKHIVGWHTQTVVVDVLLSWPRFDSLDNLGTYTHIHTYIYKPKCKWEEHRERERLLTRIYLDRYTEEKWSVCTWKIEERVYIYMCVCLCVCLCLSWNEMKQLDVAFNRIFVYLNHASLRVICLAASVFPDPLSPFIITAWLWLREAICAAAAYVNTKRTWLIVL